METLHFSIHINAPREKVWHAMLDDATYRMWSAAFNPGGSYYVGDWSKGSKILFLGPDPDHPEKIGGMVSMMEDNKLYEFISIKHIGEVRDGVEDTTSDKIKAWVGAMENYTFKDADGGTALVVDVDVVAEYLEYMRDAWPKALEKLKEIAESQ